MQSNADEIMLAQEQGVRMRQSGVRKELEGGLGGELEGTLLLTNRRLIFDCSGAKDEKLKPAAGPFAMHVVYSDVKDLESIPASGDNLFIELQSITSAEGHAGHLERPSLEIKWRESGKERGRVFVERLSGRSRHRNLNDWAGVISRLKAGEQKVTPLPRIPGTDKLEGKIMVVSADMQRRGLFEIEEEVEEQFKTKLDPDDLEAACDRLAGSGLLQKISDPSGDIYYRKRSPLGDDVL